MLAELFRRWFFGKRRDDEFIGLFVENEFKAADIAPVDASRQRRSFDGAEANRDATRRTTPRHTEAAFYAIPNRCQDRKRFRRLANLDGLFRPQDRMERPGK